MTLEQVLSLKIIKSPSLVKEDSGVHYANGRYKVEFRIEGKLHYFGSFKEKEPAVEHAKKVKSAINEYNLSRQTD